MKTKIFFGLCLVMCMALSQLYGKNFRNGGDTRTIVYDAVWPIYVLVENDDGVLVEFTGSIQYHVREHYVNGELKWLKASCQGEVTNEDTGEVFWINESNRSITPFEAWSGYFMCHDNIKGSQGSHYIMQSLWNLSTWELISVKLIIPGN